MEDINKYIGIPHFFGEASFDKCDCIGLAKLFYKEHGWIDIDDGLPITENWADDGNYRIARFFTANFDVIKDYKLLEFGDIVVFTNDNDGIIHFAIYLEYGKILAMQMPVCYGKTKSTVYHSDMWLPYFKRGYKRRK